MARAPRLGGASLALSLSSDRHASAAGWRLVHARPPEWADLVLGHSDTPATDRCARSTSALT